MPDVPHMITSKIKDLKDLGRIAADLKKDGARIVLCHGTFDLLHIGHVRHLMQARRHGDVLIATVTSDRYVRRGPDRPVFPAELRAEMLAATQYVDWVAINDSPTAEPPIRIIQPSFYVKGADYKNTSEDVTGKILDERRAVEEGGGQLVFTEDITFSSSSLINRYGNIYHDELRNYLETARTRNAAPRINDLIERAADLKVVLIGDAIVDEYHYVDPMGKSSKENLVPTRFHQSEIFAGGIFAAANHVADFCKEVEIVTVLGEDDSNTGIIRTALKPNVCLTPIFRPKAPTTRKVRFVDLSYGRKLFEVYHMDDTPLHGSLEDEVQSTVDKAIRAADVTIVTDFGHGFMTPAMQDCAYGAKFLAVNAQTNSANVGFNLITRYRRADYVCVDAPEARLACGARSASIEELASTLLPDRIDCDRIVVTHGRHGCVGWRRAQEPVRAPAFTRDVLDTMGAGDAFFSVTAPLIAIDGEMDDIIFIGNAAGALKVNIVGHRKSVGKIDLLKYCHTLLK